MPIPFPTAQWPAELTEAGPDADPSILLSGSAKIGDAHHHVLAVRVSRSNLQVDFRPDLDEEETYAGFLLEEMLEELEFFDEFDRSALVSLTSGDYVMWMTPASNVNRSGGLTLPLGAL